MARCSLRDTGVGCPEQAQVGSPALAFQVPSRGLREIEHFVGLFCGRLVGVPDSEVPNAVLLGNAHIARSPSGATQYYEDGLGGGTTRILSSSSCSGSTADGEPSIRS